MPPILKIGVVGFSRNAFDKKMAQLKLRKILEQVTAEQDEPSRSSVAIPHVGFLRLPTLLQMNWALQP
jgi:hypothetical protein